MRLDAVLPCVVQHHLIEFASHDLPRLRALVRLVVPEIERRRELATGIDELHAVFLDEMALLHFGQHVQALQHPVCFGNQRFADVEPGKPLALEELDAIASLCDERRHRRARRPAANDDDVYHRRSFSACQCCRDICSRAGRFRRPRAWPMRQTHRRGGWSRAPRISVRGEAPASCRCGP